MTDSLDSHCTFAVTGEQPQWQSIYCCRDCGQGTLEDGAAEPTGLMMCICEACADRCHADHDIEYIGMGPSFCDCGESCHIIRQSRAKAQELKCEALPLGNQEKEASRFMKAHAFSVPQLNNANLCEDLIKQARTLVGHTRETHWIDATVDIETLCGLERLAMLIFQRHVSALHLVGMQGAEWWVQVKDLASDNAAVDLHYDKDEELSSNFGLGSFPLYSTVTYLSDGSYPTVVFPHRYDEPESDMIDYMTVSHPRRGKHFLFDGRLLHGAPASEAMLHPSIRETTSKGYRVTFLVNLWKSYSPCGVKVLSESIRQTLLATEVSEALESVEMENEHIETLEINSENDLPENFKERLLLPFVSKGATWIDDDTEEELMLVTFAPAAHTHDTVHVKFGPGMQAYLEYGVEEKHNEDNEEASAPYSEDYI